MNPGKKARRFARALITRTFEFEFERMPCRIHNISNAKLTTIARAELHRQLPGILSPKYPFELQIETSASCTLKCPLCPAGLERIDSPRRIMHFSTFKTLLDEVGDHSVHAILWMWGEPLINPRFGDMVAYLKRKNMTAVTSTNGQHVDSMEDAERIVASGLDNLIVALDGATQETYSKYRVAGDVRKVFRTLELIRQAKDELGSLTPRVNVRTVVMKHNEHELPDIEEIAIKYGADMVSRKTACMPDYTGEDTDGYFAPDDSRYRRFQYKDGERVRKSVAEINCRLPWTRMTVSADGTVMSCEFDHNKTASFGNVTDGSSFLDTWRGQQASAFRRQFLADKSAYQFCADCHYRDRSQNECTVELRHLTCPTDL